MKVKSAAVMASAATAQSRGAARVSVNNCRLLVLLCLVFTPHSLAAKDVMKNERKVTPADSGLKSAADSLINKDKLELVMEYLQDAVDQANKQKAERMQTMAVAADELDSKWKIIYPLMQQVLKNSSSPFNDLLKFSKRLYNKLRLYFNLKIKSFTAEVEDMEKELEDILKMSGRQEHLHTEL
ncbi:hypothetical protein OJAV_G00183230 [Oryzias javanicus]|uniref:Uncharacterized protein n=1 Tax=Oryzias javanicus TaxID=123683 RepID=A0A437CD00_ORYJA|nr:hypothetical protein OJAV_G00183230 [Oryzias javanicus]